MKHATLRRLTYRSGFLLVLGLLILTPTASAQGYIDQIAVAHLLNRRADSLAAVPEVAYDYYVLANSSGSAPRTSTVVPCLIRRPNREA